jgi:hypothetical protein
MSKNIINTVILGICAVIVIVIAIKVFSKENKNKNSNFTEINSQKELSDVDDCSSDTIEQSQMPEKISIKKVEKSNVKVELPPNEWENEDTHLARDIVIGNKLLRKPKEKKFTRKDIKKYANKVFGAEDKMNYTSRNNITSRDKINEIFVTEGNEFCGQLGQNVADVFDNIQS